LPASLPKSTELRFGEKKKGGRPILLALARRLVD